MTTAAPLLSLPNLTTPATAAQWNSQALTSATTLGLTTTAWQPGGMARTIFAVFSNLIATSDVTVSVLAQSGFLDYCASGTVTYVDASGNTQTVFVTPDPSIPSQNPTGALGNLDVLADSVYNVQRILATFAGGTMALVNTSAVTYGPFAAGTYHVAQPTASGSPTYSNTSSLTIAPSSTTTNAVTGAASASGLIKLTVTAHGLATGAAVYVSGVLGTTEANGFWLITVVDANTFTLNGSAFVNAWSSGGTQKVYLPTTAAFTADVAGAASSAAYPANGTNTITQPVTSLVGVLVSNLAAFTGSNTESNVALAARCRLKLGSLALGGPKAAYQFFALSSILFAPLLTPAQTVSSAITRATTAIDVTTGAVTTTIANASGQVPNADVTVTSNVIQAYAVPNGGTSIVQSASQVNVTVVANLWVPSAFTSGVVSTVQVAVQAFFATLPIGGVTDAGTSATNVVPLDGVIGAIYAACQSARIPVQDLTVTLNGSASNVALGSSTAVAVLSPNPPTVNVTGV